MNDPKELYKVYADWTGQLHYWVEKNLGRHIDCEYFPDSYQFKIYSGWAKPTSTDFALSGAGDVIPISTVPNLTRPWGENTELIHLPKPQEEPTKADLDEVFRQLCLAAARVLEIDLKKPQLGAPEEKKHAFRARRVKAQE